MTDREAGEKAVEALNDTEVGGRTIKVNEQLSKEQLQDRQQKKGGRKGMITALTQHKTF